jgi:hypothetical protein
MTILDSPSIPLYTGMVVNVAQRGSEGLRVSGVQVPVHGSDRASDLGGDLADSQVGGVQRTSTHPRKSCRPLFPVASRIRCKSACGGSGFGE